MASNLKPCPFCESEDISVVEEGWCDWWAQCPECCARGPIERSEERARDAWNDRPREADSANATVSASGERGGGDE